MHRVNTRVPVCLEVEMREQASVRQQIAGGARESFETWEAVEIYYGSPMSDLDGEALLDRLKTVYSIERARFFRHPAREEAEAV